jgi:hypothetical protein
MNFRVLLFSDFREHFYNIKYSSSTHKYLNSLFNDLALRENSSTTITKYTFKELFNINNFIADKLFKSFIKSKSESLGKLEFVQGMLNLFFGDVSQLFEAIFNILDFDSNGEVHKQDVKLVLSHLPQKRDTLKKELTNQQEYFKELEEMNDLVFSDKNTLSKSEFIELAKNKASDIIILLAGYLFKNIPVYQENVDRIKASLEENSSFPKFPSSESNSLILFRNSYSGIPYFILEDKINEKDYESEDCDEDIKVHKVTDFLSKFKHNNSDLSNTFNDETMIIKSNLYDEIISSSDEETECTKENTENVLKPLMSFKSKENENIFEGSIYKLTEKTHKLKKYFLSLVNQDIFYYKDSSTKELKGMHNLRGSFILEDRTYVIDNKKYYSFIIFFSKKIRIFFTDSLASNREWIRKLRKALSFIDVKDFYDLKNCLGEGKYGHVKLAVNKETNEKVAIKILSKEQMSLVETDLARTEIDIIKFCKHPNIIRFIDVFENHKYIFLVVELMQGGDFKEYIYNMKNSLKEEKCAKIMKQLGEALQYLHNNGIIHRDLKPENIMVSNKSVSSFTVFKVMDFGLSKIVGRNEKARESYGTLCYAAPEILLKKPYDEKIDIYSLGIVLFYALSKKLPFDDENNNDEKIIKRTLLKNPEFPSRHWSNRSREAMELIKSCLCKKDESRITISEFLDFPWVNQ